MTREVLDVLPTGRNIQAVGIMIPGTNLAGGWGRRVIARCWRVGIPQQSPIPRFGDTVQTIEGLRLNNLEAQGHVQRRVPERRELRGRPSPAPIPPRWDRAACACMCRAMAAMRSAVNFANFADGAWASDNCGSPGIGQPGTRSNLSGSTELYNRNNRLTNVSEIQQIWDFNPSIGHCSETSSGFTTRSGTGRAIGDSYFDSNPSQFVYEGPHEPPRHDGSQSWQATGKDKLSVYHDDHCRPLGYQLDALGGGRPMMLMMSRMSRSGRDRHQPAAARRGFRLLQPRIHRAVSARCDGAHRESVGTAVVIQMRASTRSSISLNNRIANARKSGGSLLHSPHLHLGAQSPYVIELYLSPSAPQCRKATGGCSSSGPATCNPSPTTGHSAGDAASSDRPANDVKATRASSSRTADDEPRT